MTILRLLNIQGIAGLAAALCLALLLVIQKSETRHWRKESARFEALYRDDHSAFAVTVANYRAAAAAARAADQAAAARVAAAQDQISERTAHDFESRIAAARARAGALGLRRADPAPATDPGARRSAPMSGLPASAGGAGQAAGEDRLREPTDALIATEQAIQLDELIRWIAAQSAVAPPGAAQPSKP